MKNYLACIFLMVTVAVATLTGKTYYVSLTGNDANPGTFELPYLKIQTALNKVTAGDTIFIRGGIYKYNVKLSVAKLATETSKCYLLNYPGERVYLDFSTVPYGTRGIELKGNYWYLRGLDVYNAGDNGMLISGKFNIVDNCAFYNNKDTGLQIGGGGSKNRIINCDAYFNKDTTEGNADGFAPKLDVGDSNYFYGCRAWQNSDDGWDGYLRPANNVTTILENCWCFMNGYRENGTVSTGNGNGFKLGGSDNKLLMHNFVVTNCIAFDNRVKGFDQNNNKGALTLFNCTSYRNGTNYGMGQAIDTSKKMTIKNCASLGTYGSVFVTAVQAANSWITPLSCSVADFVSLDTSGVRGPRKADGSLPDLNFLHLKGSSGLINAGVPVGITFIGSAPDVGAYEFDPENGITEYIRHKENFIIVKNYPNPFNPSTTINFSVSTQASVRISVVAMNGSEVYTSINTRYEAGEHQFVFNAEGLPSGVYLCHIEAGLNTAVAKMLLMK